MTLLIGADPELFVRVAGTKTAFLSPEGIIPGTKEAPHKCGNGAVHCDGMAAEYNIAPAATAEEFVANNQEMLSILEEYVGEDFELVATPYAVFNKKRWKEASEASKVLGCDPDRNAYTGEENNIPEGAEGQPVRTAAGHIHVGWGEGMDVNDPDHVEACEMFARQMDYFVGVGSILFEPDFDKSHSRRQLYGKGGAYRAKPYGMEYRVLTNAWTTSPEYMEWVFNATKRAFDVLSCDDPINPYEEVKFLARGILDKSDYGPNTEHFIKQMLKQMSVPYPID